MLDFLPLSIADISNEVVGGLIVVTIGGILSWLFRHRIRRQGVRTFAGGKGGSASVRGTRRGAVGGSGGRGGVGPGGDGGHAEVEGDFSFARGGDGGNAGEHNGRGGRRTLSQGERLNMPTDTWHIGYGGAGANHPEFDRRLGLLAMFRSEYLLAFPQEIPFI